MKKSCLTCRFAMEHRDHVRLGEQVRCGKAEELFGTHLKGGKRWVNVQKSPKTDNVVNSKCGTWEHILDGEFAVGKPEPAKLAVAKVHQGKYCPRCGGAGKLTVKVMAESKLTNCQMCQGTGRVQS